jgi:hypothetical protein
MSAVKMSVEKTADGLHASSGVAAVAGAGEGAVGSSARAALKGKERAKIRIAHANTFF